MIDVAILSVIRRWHVREGVSIREISRRTKLSRNRIRKDLANGALEAVYPKRRSGSKLDGYAELLTDIHHRRPAIIDSDLFDDWLDPTSPVPQLLDGWPNCNGSARVTSRRRFQYGMDNVPG